MAPVSLQRDGSHTPSIHSSSTGVRQPEHQRARSPRKGGPEQKSREKSHRRKKKKVFSKSRNVSSRHSKRERERGKIIIIKLSFTFNFLHVHKLSPYVFSFVSFITAVNCTFLWLFLSPFGRCS